MPVPDEGALDDSDSADLIAGDKAGTCLSFLKWPGRCPRPRDFGGMTRLRMALTESVSVVNVNVFGVGTRSRSRGPCGKPRRKLGTDGWPHAFLTA